jgi:hypothetical protein
MTLLLSSSFHCYSRLVSVCPVTCFILSEADVMCLITTQSCGCYTCSLALCMLPMIVLPIWTRFVWKKPLLSFSLPTGPMVVLLPLLILVLSASGILDRLILRTLFARCLEQANVRNAFRTARATFLRCAQSWPASQIARCLLFPDNGEPDPSVRLISMITMSFTGISHTTESHR